MSLPRRLRANVRDPHPATVSGFTVGVMFFLCGLYTFFTILLPTPPGFHVGAVSMIGLSAVIGGPVLMALPWARIPNVARLAIAPVAMTLIAFHNVAAGTDPFRYGMFFFLVFVWFGLCEPRGTSLRMSPFLVIAYLTPLIMRDASASDLASLSYTLPLYLTVGELLAWRTDRLRQLQDRLRRLAEHDSLTGLPNRAAFMTALRDRCAGPGPVAVLFLDLDGFKQINDRLGHAAGDDVLVQVAEALREMARPGLDLPGRLAGDEFVMLLPETSAAEAEAIADRTVRRLRELRAADGTPVGASAGIAAGHGIAADLLLAQADEAMYAAKQRRPASAA
ncbi:GGDEF domain-containing protein [Actinoplanes sp. NPDC023714]|uniref:GGDEF domain-containing protein n=1 Tax=Actinoplanes sp. NPDC023714 TaxID=3154322 RepID=UPI00340D3240